ncbi:MAG: S-layer homology domain-containing protein, partial [Oscillospiraceae bacterium]|nr:S-layer homology domain-containing protein [Oscillospiraceae bacterium]
AGEPAVTGYSDFTDVSGNVYYAKAVAWASQSGIVNGVGDNRFAPDTQITREQLAAIIMRYIGYAQINYITTKEYRYFADEDEISDFAKGAVQTLNKLKILGGKGNDVIDPKESATRAEVAAMLHRLLESVVR